MMTGGKKTAAHRRNRSSSRKRTVLLNIVAILSGLLCCFGVALDAFHTIILPRRPARRLRITRLFYIATWIPWAAFTERVQATKKRDQLYSVFGPLSLLLLLALWATLLIAGFGLVSFGLGSPYADGQHLSQTAGAKLLKDFYVSGTTLFTVGLGDVLPLTRGARFLTVVEGGTGLGFVALVIGYLPVLYQAFSRREVNVAMLDGRAGSPPTATELLRRHAHEGGEQELITLLAEWERWSAELLESHVSYPILCLYRSQHDNQSWLGALVAILDACALLITTVEGPAARQSQLTFSMARHALIDLGHVFSLDKHQLTGEHLREDRLPKEIFGDMCEILGELHMRLCGDPASMERLRKIRMLYEPPALALSEYLRVPLPRWVPEPKKTDPWLQVAALRYGSPNASPEAALNAEEHVSPLSTADHLLEDKV